MQRQSYLNRIVYMKGRADKARGFTYGGGILDDGTQVIGYIPMCTTQKFTWSLAKDKSLGEHGFRGHVIFGKPNIHKGRVSLPLTLVTNESHYDSLPEDCQKEARRTKPARTPIQMLYVNFDAIVNYNDTVTCIQNNAECRSLDAKLVDAIMGRLTNWRDIIMMPQGDFKMPHYIREEPGHGGTNVEYYYATVHAQFARIFETLFGLTYSEIQKIRPIELAMYYRHLCSRGAAHTLEPYEFVNRLCTAETNTSDPLAGSVHEKLSTMNVAPTARSRTFAVQTPLRVALRIYKQQKTEGLDSVDPVDSDGMHLHTGHARTQDQDASGGGGSGSSLAELLKRVGKAMEGSGMKRNAPPTFANDGEESKPAKKKKKTNAFELEVVDSTRGTVLLSTDWRKTRVKLPDFTKISDDDWIDCRILTTLRNEYSQTGHMCLDNVTLDRMILEANESDFPAHLSSMNVWSRLLHLFSIGKISIFDTSDGVYLTDTDMEDLMLNYETMPVHLLIGLREIMNQERETTEWMQTFIAKWREDKDTMSAVTDHISCIDTVFVPGSPYAQMKLSNGQWEALVKALISPISFISGPGGTGKSTLMQIMSLAFRSCGLHGTFLYTMFKNGTRLQTKASIEKLVKYIPDVIKNTSSSSCSAALFDRHTKITTDAWNAQDGENICATCDSVIMGKYRNAGRKLAIEVLIIEESSMVSLAHLYQLLFCLDLRVLKRICMIGDKEQLPALQPGEPFRHLVEALPGLSVSLTSGFRTNSGVITNLLNCVRQCNVEDMRFDEPDDPDGTCFVHMDPFENTHNYYRCSNYVLEKYSTSILEMLQKVDPEKQKYDDIMPITTYNDMARFVSCIIHNYYFDLNISLRQAIDYAVSKSETPTAQTKKTGQGQDEEDDKPEGTNQNNNKSEPSGRNTQTKSNNRIILPIVKNSRVVILISDKELDLARGHVGKVTLIIDHSYVAPEHGFDSFPSVRSTAAPLTRNCTHRTIIVDEKLRLTFRGAHGYTSTLEPGGCITVHRSQGSEYPVVFAVLPSGKNLANNRVIYTAISRTRNECHVFGSFDHINKMITTPAILPLNTLKQSLECHISRDTIGIIETMVMEYYDSIITMFRHKDSPPVIDHPVNEDDDDDDPKTELDNAAWNQIHNTLQQRQKANMVHRAIVSRKD